MKTSNVCPGVRENVWLFMFYPRRISRTSAVNLRCPSPTGSSSKEVRNKFKLYETSAIWLWVARAFPRKTVDGVGQAVPSDHRAQGLPTGFVWS